jgi:hypothetical protein
MLGWIWIWEDEGTNFHRVKVRFGNLWFYLSIYRPHSITPLENSILSQGAFYKNTCSRQERWKELGEPDYKDYRDLTLIELARIIFLKAPEEERQEREAEWEGLGSYYRRRLPMKIDLNVFWYPNRFDIQFPGLDLTFDVWKRLPKRQNKRKPKNIVRWFDSAVDTGAHSDYYFCTPLGNFEVNLSTLIWWLGDEWSEVLLNEMFGNV